MRQVFLLINFNEINDLANTPNQDCNFLLKRPHPHYYCSHYLDYRLGELTVSSEKISYTLILTQSPIQNESNITAQSLVSELIDTGGIIDRVFFYQDAVYTGLKPQIPGQGLETSYQGWLALQKKQSFPLQLCIANSLRRGIHDEAEANRYSQAANLQQGFQLSGLGEIAEACQSSDRIIRL